mmetsp:Transcript_22145/g.55419  ORF Transcript_22145/g.55419 Transcript_22145/m.55419 type:complete len:223 (+) Transcript_22145:463-1131(+)
MPATWHGRPSNPSNEAWKICMSSTEPLLSSIFACTAPANGVEPETMLSDEDERKQSSTSAQSSPEAMKLRRCLPVLGKPIHALNLGELFAMRSSASKSTTTSHTVSSSFFTAELSLRNALLLTSCETSRYKWSLATIPSAMKNAHVLNSYTAMSNPIPTHSRGLKLWTIAREHIMFQKIMTGMRLCVKMKVIRMIALPEKKAMACVSANETRWQIKSTVKSE